MEEHSDYFCADCLAEFTLASVHTDEVLYCPFCSAELPVDYEEDIEQDD